VAPIIASLIVILTFVKQFGIAAVAFGFAVYFLLRKVCVADTEARIESPFQWKVFLKTRSAGIICLVAAFLWLGLNARPVKIHRHVRRTVPKDAEKVENNESTPAPIIETDEHFEMTYKDPPEQETD